MKKQSSVIFKWLCISILSIFVILPAMAQKEINLSLVTQQQINTINELVKPLKEQIEKQFNEDKTGKYKEYQEDIKKIIASKNIDEKRELSNQIYKNYIGFFTEVWGNLKIDENLYQQKIKNIFPETVSGLIQFGPFLNFSITKSTRKPSAPAPAPSPKDICVDICPIASGEITGTSALISGNGGQYGNCFLKTSAWGVFAGISSLRGQLKNNISIPGTFPNDSRKLHIRISYNVKIEATAFSLLGLGSAEASVQTYQTTEYLFAGSPFFCAIGKTINKSIIEDYILEKKDFANSIFKSFAGASGFVISANWSAAEINSIKWSICEEK